MEGILQSQEGELNEHWVDFTLGESKVSVRPHGALRRCLRERGSSQVLKEGQAITKNRHRASIPSCRKEDGLDFT